MKYLDFKHTFTAGPQEIRAWTIQKNASAPNAAGVIHTDFERGFIKAEVIVLMIIFLVMVNWVLKKMES